MPEKVYTISFNVRWDMNKWTLQDALCENLYNISDKITTEISVEEMGE